MILNWHSLGTQAGSQHSVELKKWLLVKNVIAAVPHTDETAADDAQCMVRDVKSDKTVSAKSSNKSARCSK